MSLKDKIGKYLTDFAESRKVLSKDHPDYKVCKEIAKELVSDDYKFNKKVRSDAESRLSRNRLMEDDRDYYGKSEDKSKIAHANEYFGNIRKADKDYNCNIIPEPKDEDKEFENRAIMNHYLEK